MEHDRYYTVFKSWIELFTQDVLKKFDLSFCPKASETVKAMLYKRILDVSMPVLEKYTDLYIEEQNPFFCL